MIGIIHGQGCVDVGVHPGQEPQCGLRLKRNEQGIQCCKPDDTLATAENLMREKKIRRLPATDDGGRLLGIFAINDIAQEAARDRTSKKKEVSDAEVGETVAAVCEARFAREPVAAT